jgi:hypothetical protein
MQQGRREDVSRFNSALNDDRFTAVLPLVGWLVSWRSVPIGFAAEASVTSE